MPNNCPPVEINANGLTGGKITLRDIESSQYVSALLLCAPYMPAGIDLTLQGGIVSMPYIDLRLSVCDFRLKITRIGEHEFMSMPVKFIRGVNIGWRETLPALDFFLAAALLRKTIKVAGINRQREDCLMFWKNWAV